MLSNGFSHSDHNGEAANVKPAVNGKEPHVNGLNGSNSVAEKHTNGTHTNGTSESYHPDVLARNNEWEMVEKAFGLILQKMTPLAQRNSPVVKFLQPRDAAVGTTTTFHDASRPTQF